MNTMLEKNEYKNKHTTLIDKCEKVNIISTYKYNDLQNVNFCKVNIKNDAFNLVPECVHFVVGNIKKTILPKDIESMSSIYDIANEMKNSHYIKKSLGYKVLKYEGEGTIKLKDIEGSYIIIEFSDEDEYILNKEYFCGCSSKMEIDIVETVVEVLNAREDEDYSDNSETQISELIIKGEGIVIIKLNDIKEKIDEIEINEDSKALINFSMLPILRDSNIFINNVSISEGGTYNYDAEGTGILWLR